MKTLRDLLKDRSVSLESVKKTPVDLAKGQRDSLQTLINGWKLETFGKALSMFQAVAVPGMESIREDLSVIEQLSAHQKDSMDTFIRLRVAAHHYQSKGLQLSLEDYSNYLASKIGSASYLLLCNAKPHNGLLKAFPKTLEQALDLVDHVALIQKLVGDFSDGNSARAIAEIDYTTTQFTVTPVYGRNSDAFQIRTLFDLYKSVEYCDPIGPAPDFWPNFDYVLNPNCGESSVLKIPQVTTELLKAEVQCKRWGTGLKRTARDYLGEVFTQYLLTLVDRITALLLLIAIQKKILYCATELLDTQIVWFQTRLKEFVSKEDYDLILDELIE